MKFDDTRVLSTDWASCTILTFKEVPPDETVLIDRPTEPYFSTGEASQWPTGAAVANAIADATDVRVRRVPVTPDPGLIRPIMDDRFCNPRTMSWLSLFISCL